jgi:hypothetical protein
MIKANINEILGTVFRSSKHTSTRKHLDIIAGTFIILTFPDSHPPTRHFIFQIIEPVHQCQNLDPTHSIQHMRIMSRCSTKSAIVWPTIEMQTAEDELQNALAWQSVRLPQKVARSKSPVQTIQAQMLGEPVLELVFARIKSLNI